MAYDAATGTVVLFGGSKGNAELADTWTWDGATWTRQHLVTSPPGRSGAVMAYDAATRTVVLFSGFHSAGRDLTDTWTWDGTTWTRQHPAASPPPRDGAAMAYDAAAGTVVLFGGYSERTSRGFGDTWTWNGTTWTRQHPATSPPGRSGAAMAYDAATGTVVMYGGYGKGKGGDGEFGDTWTWNGTTWTRQHPATSPPGRWDTAMAYDAAAGTVVLFGGWDYASHALGDTWTWNGATWTQQAPATSPPADYNAAMAYDAAAGTVVLFGGQGQRTNFLRDTWAWG